MAVPPEESCQADYCIPAIFMGPDTHLLIFDSASKLLHQDVVKTALPPQPADLDPFFLSPLDEFPRSLLCIDCSRERTHAIDQIKQY
jgi:hypothetical protein